MSTGRAPKPEKRRVAPRRVENWKGRLRESPGLAGVGGRLHRVPDQASAGRGFGRIGRRRRIGRPVDDLMPVCSRVELVGRVQEHGNDLDGQQAGEDQADHSQEDANAWVHDGHSLPVGPAQFAVSR